MMFTEPLVAYLSIYTGFAFAMIFSFFGSYSYVFASVYQFQPREIGLAFLGVLPGFILAIITFGIFGSTRASAVCCITREYYDADWTLLVYPLYFSRKRERKNTDETTRFAWSAKEDVHWIVPVLSGVPFAWGMLSIFVCPTPSLRNGPML
jgi:hypothetical protein